MTDEQRKEKLERSGPWTLIDGDFAARVWMNNLVVGLLSEDAEYDMEWVKAIPFDHLIKTMKNHGLISEIDAEKEGEW